MKRLGITILSTLLVSTTANAQAPAGWKVFKEDRAKCQMAVPADWRQQEIFGKKLSAAYAPDKTADAVVNLMEGTDWAKFQSLVYSIYTQEKDRPKIQDSPKRLWFEIVSRATPGMTSWYVAVPGAAGTCNAQVNFKKGDRKSEEVARKIVETIRAS